MNKVIAPVLASVAALGIVGGVAAAQAFKPVEKPAQVRLVEPAAQTVTETATPSPTTTTVAPKPVKRVKVAVSSTTTTKATSATPQTVQRQAIVSDPTPTSTSPSTTAEVQPATPGGPPPVLWGSDGKPPAPTTSAK